MTRELYTNNLRELPRPGTINHLITEGLGYCCEGLFWQLYASTPSDLIAARLGVTPRAVNTHRRAYLDGDLGCKNLGGCQRSKLVVKELL